MSAAISVKNLSKTYADFALKDVTFTLPRGCIMGLCGENGAGKSTTLRLILGLARPDRGEVQVLGGACEEHREQIGVVLDESCFPENLCPREIARVMQKIYKTWDMARFSSLLARFQLPDRKCVREYSRGMKMKLTIAAALAHDSRLLILDEATSGLDPVVRDEILDIFLEFIQDGERSILISSHIISDLEKLCDYIALLHRGTLLVCEQKDVLLERFGMFRGSAEDLDALPDTAVCGVRRHQFGVEALVRRDGVRAQLDPATMEEIMLYLIKGETSCGD